jgi:hypothetical protein
MSIKRVGRELVWERLPKSESQGEDYLAFAYSFRTKPSGL